ncbi:Uncharacterized protein Rs2_27135 [Raphanus sativus]|nr:Uncharacterized protein Rs2_27135 [Raphanus sativus]
MSDESSALLLPNSPSPFLYSRSFIFFDLKPTGQLKPYKEESSFDIFDVDHFINALKDDIRLQQEACKIRHFPPVQRCVSSNVTGVIRFHLEAVVDNQDSATFIVSDREITKLIEKEVTSLALEEMSSGGGGATKMSSGASWKGIHFQLCVTS